VFVFDSLLYFVKNTEELAGTLCHEVSHTIHHDTVTLMEKQQQRKSGKSELPFFWARLVRTCSPSFCSESFIRWATRETSNHALTLRASTCGLLPATTGGDSYGCSRILRMRRLARYHSFYQITPMTKIVQNVLVLTHRVCIVCGCAPRSTRSLERGNSLQIWVRFGSGKPGQTTL